MMATAENVENRSVNWVQMEATEVSNHHSSSGVAGIRWGERAPAAAHHECTFHLNNPNAKLLEDILQKVSDPRSPSYGKHLSKEEVDKLSHNLLGEQAVISFLSTISPAITITSKTASSITASGPISEWEKALHTEFHEVINIEENPERVLLRTKAYFLPDSVANHVLMVSGTVQMPFRIHRKGPLHLR